MIGYYEGFRFNSLTGAYDIWIGTGTHSAILKAGGILGGFIGYDKPTPDGWGCKAKG